MFEFLNVPFSYLMKGCLWASGNNYLLALLFFALVVQIVLLPLAIKQHKSQIKMAEMRPKEIAIREKYKGRNDKVTQQKMSMEIQEMYQENGYSPFSGCLPLLIQLPIIFILFAIVRQPISYGARLDEGYISDYSERAFAFYTVERDAIKETVGENDDTYKNIENYLTALGRNDEGNYDSSKYNKQENEIVLSRFIKYDGEENINILLEKGKITEEQRNLLVETYNEFIVIEDRNLEEDREALPNYRIGPVNLVEKPSLSDNFWLLLIPALVFLTSFLSTKITRKFSGNTQTDANGNPIGGGFFLEVGMPIISAIFCFSFSAAVGVYWIWRSVIGMLQTVLLAKFMPIPKVTEEQIAEAKRELKGKVKKKKVITIEVDEDDNSYDDMIVRKSDSGASSSKNANGVTRSPRKIEMLSADDDAPTQTELYEPKSSDVDKE